MSSHRFQWNFASLKGPPQNSKRQTDFCFGFFSRGDRPTPPPPRFLGFDWGNRFHILSKCPTRASVNLIDGLLINRGKETTVFFRLFDSSKYLTTLRSNISPCQKATTLILIPLYNPSFHLWKSSKKSLGTTVFLSWMPFKICDCDKFLSTTPVTQFLL